MGLIYLLRINHPSFGQTKTGPVFVYILKLNQCGFSSVVTHEFIVIVKLSKSRINDWCCVVKCHEECI